MMRYVYKLGIMTLIAASIFAVFFAWLCEEPLASDEFKKLIMEAIRPTLKKAVMGGLIMIFSYFAFLREFVFDGNKKLFIYRKSFFFFKSRSVYGRYSDVDAITISYFFKPNKSSGVMMTVILKNGKNVETENFDPKLYSQRIEVINNKAKELADTIGCRFLPGEPGKRVVSTIKANGTIFYEYEPAKTRY
ncbi:MAG: hypothetical protein GX031_00530 [Candidatus Riflebacteria bacterium]|nr:hypothetical protein [Candidatus Riflebacteria bacterium]